MWLPQYTCKLKSSPWLCKPASGVGFFLSICLNLFLQVRDKRSQLNFWITLVAARSLEDPKYWLTNTGALQWSKHLACTALHLPSLPEVTGSSLWNTSWAAEHYIMIGADLGLQIPFTGLLSASPSSCLWVSFLALPFPLNIKPLLSGKVWADLSPAETLSLLTEKSFSCSLLHGTF